MKSRSSGRNIWHNMHIHQRTQTSFSDVFNHRLFWYFSFFSCYFTIVCSIVTEYN